MHSMRIVIIMVELLPSFELYHAQSSVSEDLISDFSVSYSVYRDRFCRAAFGPIILNGVRDCVRHEALPWLRVTHLVPCSNSIKPTSLCFYLHSLWRWVVIFGCGK